MIHVASQNVSMFKGTWAYSVPAYVPTATEWALTAMGFGIALALHAFGEKLFHLSDLPPHAEAEKMTLPVVIS